MSSVPAHPCRILNLLCLSLIAVSTASAAEPAKTNAVATVPDVIAFNRDIRPILSEKCYACHGPDKNKRKADLRLDTQEGLLGSAGAKGAVVPGKPDESELWHRVMAESADERMPPAESGKDLTDVERQIIRRWIEQGGKWEGHWSFLPIARPKPPTVDPTQSAYVRNDVDKFILHTIREKGLNPSPVADPATLVRRVRFDLTGLPPTVDEVNSFVASPTLEAYEKFVDQLLASPQYGERMAMWWLDLVRYADSVGYHGDQPVTIWPFRDYVIKSFNENKTFDKFTLEQLAGDLLPSPTTEQKVASGYNRLGMMSAEGGVQPKEYLSKYIAERVRNLSGTWLGVTFGCCECHNHKFDPFAIRDFYSLEAFFADIEERGLYAGANVDGSWGPRIQLPTPEQVAEVQRLDAAIAPLQKQMDTPTAELAAAQKEWEKQPPKDLPAEIQKIVATSEQGRSAADADKLAAYYRSIAPLLEAVRKPLGELKKQRADLEVAIPTTLVTVAVAPRTIKVLARGNWLDESGEVMEPAFPAALSSQQAHAGRLNRADLGKWVTSAENPLTARVFVNRLWQMYFGTGLSRRVNDHGAQGDWPSHPELLDWLAGQFIDSGWNVKHVVKLMVMSGTYRQSSQVTSETVARDPENRWLARQNRFRLSAETVRDNALSLSGLLVGKVGGPSVKPYQPPGYWAYLNFPPREWQNGAGDELYRRSLYTHWQRQYLHPAMLAFDAPGREECIAERGRSNTPLQSLVLMNDPEFVEAARAFAEQILQQGGATMRQRLNWAYMRAFSRQPIESEIDVLEKLIANQLEEYKNDSKAADELVAVGVHAAPAQLDHAELAAWTNAARAILNVHETITRN